MSPRRGRRRRTYRLPEEQMVHLSGIRATWDGDCQRCPDPILQDQRVVRHGSGWIHVGCASGADDQ